MGANTHISWCDHTFNPWEGCTKVSPGCTHCYAEARNQRFSAGANWGKGAPRRRTNVQNWNQVRKWNRQAPLFLQCTNGCRFQSTEAGLNGFCPQCGDPQADTVRPRVFVASLADWLDDEVPVEWLADLLALIHECQNLDFLLLTKRPEKFRTRLEAVRDWCIKGPGESLLDLHLFVHEWVARCDREPPANVWIGTTVEDQTRADERIPVLLAIPARVRFLSCEPLLGSLDLVKWLHPDGRCGECLELIEVHRDYVSCGCCVEGGEPILARNDLIDWVICGGESGPGARPMHPDWARSLRNQCSAAGVPFHFKQWGEWIPGDHVESLPDHEPKRITQIALDGTVASSTHMPYEKREGMKTICLVGKRITGRLLDGIEHHAFPEVRA